jgi:hypothetical protein
VNVSGSMRYGVRAMRYPLQFNAPFRYSVSVLALVLAACGGASSPASDPSTGETPAAPAEAAPAEPAAPVAEPDRETEPGQPTQTEPQVTLIDGGKDPKTELRFRAKPNRKEKLVLVMDMQISTELGGKAGPVMKLPKTQMSMDLQATSVAANGDIAYRFELKSVKVVPGKDTKPEVAKAMDGEFKKMEGLKGTAVIDSRGIAREAKFEETEPSMRELTEAMSLALNMISNPLPAEPVGLGAKWDSKLSSRQQGMVLQQINHATLESKKGDVIVIRLQIEQTAKPQLLSLPNLPPNAKAKLIELSSQGSGMLKSNLTRLVPVESQMDLKSRSAVEVGDGKQSTRLATDLILQMHIKGN